MAIALCDTVAEARGNGKETERHQICSQRSTDINALTGTVSTVTLCQWVCGSIFYILGSSIPNGILLCVGRRKQHMSGILTIIPLCFHVLTEVLRIVYIGRSQRINRYHSVQERTITITQSPCLIFLYRSVTLNTQPIEELVVGVELSREALIGILVPLYHTVVIDDAKTYKEVSFVITTFNGDVVLETPTALKYLIVPVGIETTCSRNTYSVSIILRIIFIQRKFCIGEIA